jgi:ABC-type phosphate/phosphonate transport system substrate-binding protein
MSAVIITRSDRNDINKIEDLEGRTISTSSENSYEYWIALKEMKKHNIDVNKDIKEVRYKQSMQKVIEMVESGDADAGIITTGILELKYQDQKKNVTKLKVINSLKNEDIPVFHTAASTRERAWALLWPNNI